VPGGTVRDWLREHGSLGAEQAEAILRDVASALGYAHRRGLVHRDVKPENIFLDEVRGRALLSDFGIARKIDGDGSITLLGAALGTPQYMSPEQIDGEMVDGRSDIYSLGVLGWELLTGRRPWAGESLYGVIYKQKHEQLPRITSLRPRVPANLLFAIEGALQKGKAERWQTIDEFLTQLTYNPPPLLSQTYPPGATQADNEPTVRFRSPTLQADEPKGVAIPAAPAPTPKLEPEPVDDVVTVSAPESDSLAVVIRGALSASDATTSPVDPPWSEIDNAIVDTEPNAEPPFQFTSRRMRVAQVLALVVPLAIAATALFVVLGGSARDAARPTSRSTGVTSSAGSIAGDSVPAASTATRASNMLASPATPSPVGRPLDVDAGSSVSPSTPSDDTTTAPRTPSAQRSTRIGGTTTAKRPTSAPRGLRVDSSRAVATVRPGNATVDSNGAGGAAAKVDAPSPAPVEDPFKIPPAARESSPALGGAGGVPIARCRIAATADQRACLAAYIDAGDAPLNRTFDSLVSELRRIAGTAAGAPDPPAVQRIRVEQRAWLGVRETECPRQPVAGAGEFWAQAQSQCFAEMASSRAEDLRDALHRVRRK
jgi:serine/threonine protein kinase/uncharacterized protein YecT (DUF1311 family)